jgi:hypothetical protein
MLSKLATVAFAAVIIGLPLPTTATADVTPTVTCKDGSTSAAGRGACSHHGGVAKPSAPAAPPATAPVPAPAPAAPPVERKAPPRPSTAQPGQPTARCKDGTLSYAKHHSGACSHHGGVSTWL